MANSNQYAIGNIVKLRSGGPDMTVRAVPDMPNMPNMPGKTYLCQWFAGKKLEQGSFPGESLEPVQASKP